MKNRCCLCRQRHGLEPTDLPGSGWRCADHIGCRRRVREIVSSHTELARTLGQ